MLRHANHRLYLGSATERRYFQILKKIATFQLRESMIWKYEKHSAFSNLLLNFAGTELGDAISFAGTGAESGKRIVLLLTS